MINLNKIEEWIQEVEERPISAPLIIRYIANRMADLSSRNEELLAENIELRTGRKVEEYESRIANLEYQVELLKRQLGGETILQTDAPVVETVNMILYNTLGQAIRVELPAADLVSGVEAASFSSGSPGNEPPPGLMVTSSLEELLFVFDSGRTVAAPVTEIPALEPKKLDWEQAYYQEPRGIEELAVIHPIGKMSLYEFCIQSSRKGYIKKILEKFLENHIASNYIGTGVKQAYDKTCGLAFCGKEDIFVMISQEGFLSGLEVNKLPLTIEEAVRLSATDHIVSTFILGEKPSILAVTQNGKAIHRLADWVEPAASFKSRGQPLFSREKREAGIRVVGAASVDEDDWGLVLRDDGKLVAYQVGDLFASGNVLEGQAPSGIAGFSAFTLPGNAKNHG